MVLVGFAKLVLMGCSLLEELPSYPVRARHDLGSKEAKIGAGERERGGREAVETGAKLSYGVTERYGAGY